MLKSYINLKEMFNLIISKYNNNIFNNPISRVFLIYKINIIFIKKICNKICLWRSWLLSQVFLYLKLVYLIIKGRGVIMAFYFIFKG